MSNSYKTSWPVSLSILCSLLMLFCFPINSQTRVDNHSEKTIWVKPEDNTKPWEPLGPHSTYYGDQDGIASGGNVYKVGDKIDMTVKKDGAVTYDAHDEQFRVYQQEAYPEKREDLDGTWDPGFKEAAKQRESIKKEKKDKDVKNEEEESNENIANDKTSPELQKDKSSTKKKTLPDDLYYELVILSDDHHQSEMRKKYIKQQKERGDKIDKGIVLELNGEYFVIHPIITYPDFLNDITGNPQEQEDLRREYEEQQKKRGERIKKGPVVKLGDQYFVIDIRIVFPQDVEEDPNHPRNQEDRRSKYEEQQKKRGERNKKGPVLKLGDQYFVIEVNVDPRPDDDPPKADKPSFEIPKKILWTRPSQVPEEIKIGFNIPLTGRFSRLGISAKNAALLFSKSHPWKNGKSNLLKLNIIYENNQSHPQSATTLTQKLIEHDKVHCIIGPLTSGSGIPAGHKANELRTPMISPGSMLSEVYTKRPFVFCLFPSGHSQGLAAAHFAKNQLIKTAVLYGNVNSYSNQLISAYLKAYKNYIGAIDPIVHQYNPKDKSSFLTESQKIISKNVRLLIIPEFVPEIATVAKAVRNSSKRMAILTSIGLFDVEPIKICGKDCEGVFIQVQYTTARARDTNEVFIRQYKKMFGYPPDTVSALTWDALTLTLQALKETNHMPKDLDGQREALRKSLRSIKQFSGVTGQISFNDEGGVDKCASIIRIDKNGKGDFHKLVCP